MKKKGLKTIAEAKDEVEKRVNVGQSLKNIKVVQVETLIAKIV